MWRKATRCEKQLCALWNECRNGTAVVERHEDECIWRVCCCLGAGGSARCRISLIMAKRNPAHQGVPAGDHKLVEELRMHWSGSGSQDWDSIRRSRITPRSPRTAQKTVPVLTLSTPTPISSSHCQLDALGSSGLSRWEIGSHRVLKSGQTSPEPSQPRHLFR